MKDDIIAMAREAGCIPVRHPEYDSDVQVFATPDVLERFAALVIANNQPQSSMAWQEGFEAGRLAEREACAKVCEDDKTQAMEWTGNSRPGGHFAAAIRARGQAKDEMPLFDDWNKDWTK